MSLDGNDSEELPDELHEALSEGGFDPLQKYSRWTYAEVFVRKKADSSTRALTRREVEADLAEYNGLDPARSTSYEALGDLVEADILDINTDLDTHQYWLSSALDSTPAGAIDDAPASESDPTSGELTHSPVPVRDTSSQSRLRYLSSTPFPLSLLVIGLSLVVLTAVLLRLSVPRIVWGVSAIFAWGAISFGSVALIFALLNSRL